MLSVNSTSERNRYNPNFHDSPGYIWYRFYSPAPWIYIKVCNTIYLAAHPPKYSKLKEYRKFVWDRWAQPTSFNNECAEGYYPPEGIIVGFGRDNE